MKTINEGLLTVLLVNGLFLLTLCETETRKASSQFIHKGCKSKGSAFARKKVSSLLQCQQFCTFKDKCRYFAFRKQASGVCYCNLYNSINILSECDGSKNWATYSVDREPEEKSQAEHGSEKSDEIVSYVFPDFSVANSIKASTQGECNITSFTVSMWVKLYSSKSGGVSLFSYSSTQECPYLLIKITPVGLIIVTKSFEVSIFSLPKDNVYMHIGVTWSNENARAQLFMNGSLANTASTQKQLNFQISRDGSFYAGISYKKNSGSCQADSSSTFKGEITQVYMWNRELSAASIAAAMRMDPPLAGRVYDWDNSRGQESGSVFEKAIEKSTFLIP